MFFDMDERPTFQQQLDWLNHGEVMPILLATDTSYRENFQVHVVLLDPGEAGPHGYASLELMTRHYAEAPSSLEVERSRRNETVVAVAERLRELLA